MKIYTNSEFMDLRSMVIGRADHAHWPKGDPFFDSLTAVSTWPTPLKSGAISQDIIEGANNELDDLAEAMDKMGVEVHRPDVVDWSQVSNNLDHATTGMHTYSTRDLLLVIDDMVIECPTPYVSRQNEFRAFDSIRRSAISSGARWIAAPRPRMLEDDYFTRDGRVHLNNNVPMFDAANILKFGDKILYLVSSSGNEAGADWLQSVLGNTHEVIKWTDVYSFSHIDSTLAILNSNTILANATRVTTENIPNFLKHCDVIWVEDMVPREFAGFPFASKWIGINVLAVNPETVVVDSIQEPLIADLNSHGFRTIEMPLTHSRTLGGGFHCTTLDLRRDKF
jgi:N-dimethylarginine dimethylaminohydrolase